MGDSTTNGTFQQALQVRIATIGMFPTISTFELFLNGRLLPNEIREDENFKIINETAALLVGIANDLCSLGKDLHHFGCTNQTIEQQRRIWPNLVFGLITFEWKELVEAASSIFDKAVCAIVALYHASIQRFDHHCALLLAVPHLDVATKAQLHDYQRLVRYCVYGFNWWQAMAPRYTKYPVTTETGAIYSFAINANGD